MAIINSLYSVSYLEYFEEAAKKEYCEGEDMIKFVAKAVRPLDKVEVCQSTLVLSDLTVQERSFLIFTSPKPGMTELPSTMRSWRDALRGRGKLVAFANDEVTHRLCRENDIPVLCVQHTDEKLPRFDSMMGLMQEYGSDIVGFVNSDIAVKGGVDSLYNFLRKPRILEILEPTEPHMPYNPTGRLSSDWFAISTRNDIIGDHVAKHTKGGFDFWAWNVGSPLLPFNIPPFRFPLSTYDNWLLDMVTKSGKRNVIDVSDVVTLVHKEHKKVGGSAGWYEAAHMGVSGVYLNKHFGHAEPRSMLNGTNSPYKSLHYTWQFGTAQDVPHVATSDGTVQKRGYWSPIKDFHCNSTSSCSQYQATQAGTAKSELEYKHIPILEPTVNLGEKHWYHKVEKNWRYTMEQQLSRHATKDKYVMVTAVNYAYRKMLLNFLCTLERVGMRDHVVVAAMDPETYEWGVREGLPIFLPSSAPREMITGTYGSLAFRSLTKLKSAFVLEVLEAGYSVVWSDVDITWFVHPFHALNSFMEGDGIAIQSNAPMVANPAETALPHETVAAVEDESPAGRRRLNSGLYVAPRNELVITAFREIVQDARQREDTEQPSFDHILCQSPSKRLYNSCIYHPRSASHQGEKLVVSLLDRYQFPNGAVLVGDKNQNVFETGKSTYERLTQAKLLCAHNNWIVGKDNKFARMKDVGWWYLKGDQCTYQTSVVDKAERAFLSLNT